MDPTRTQNPHRETAPAAFRGKGTPGLNAAEVVKSKMINVADLNRLEITRSGLRSEVSLAPLLTSYEWDVFFESEVWPPGGPHSLDVNEKGLSGLTDRSRHRHRSVFSAG